jgi:3-isopropylmalate/(R)-2-methylmalate dehydratase small subunit
MMAENMMITRVTGRGIPLPGNDIDTDRIIPAHFMKCITFDGLGAYAFYDARYDGDGNRTAHPFNSSRFEEGAILFVNKNFGCGSLCEHAPQALVRPGIRAIIGESFAEIFADNCTALGVPTVTVLPEHMVRLMHLVDEVPHTAFTIDLERGTVEWGTQRIACALPESSREALIHGVWDSTAQLLANTDIIEKTLQALPYLAFSP